VRLSSRTFNALNALVSSEQVRFKQTPERVCTAIKTVVCALYVYPCVMLKVWQGDKSGAFHRRRETVESELQPSD